jgi:ABC-type glycerol-3-phosphate transport system substrate-binding protein
MKRVLLCLLIVLLASTSLFAGARQEKAAKSKVVFYGEMVEFPIVQTMIEKLRAKLPQYDIQTIVVDWANLETVIRTGIASGKPADIYHYWPQEMKPFVDAKQVLDLTPYLEANNGEWRKTFVPSLLDEGKFNGKYYGIPLVTNFGVLFLNKGIFTAAGVAIPDKETWSEFVAASGQIKKNTKAYPFAIGKEPDIFGLVPRNGYLSLAETDDQLSKLHNGQINVTTSPIFSTILDNLKAYYQNDYWYPGQGAVAVSRDEAKSAFLRGEAAMLAEVASLAGQIMDAAGFDVETMNWPFMGKREMYVGGADGYLVPINAPNPQGAIDVLKVWTSKDVISLFAQSTGMVVANQNVETTDPVTAKLKELSGYTAPVADRFYSLSPEIKQYIQQEFVQDYVLGIKDKATILKELENLRLKAIQ